MLSFAYPCVGWPLRRVLTTNRRSSVSLVSVHRTHTLRTPKPRSLHRYFLIPFRALIESWLDGVFKGKYYRTLRICADFLAFGPPADGGAWTCYKCVRGCLLHWAHRRVVWVQFGWGFGWVGRRASVGKRGDGVLSPVPRIRKGVWGHGTARHGGNRSSRSPLRRQANITPALGSGAMREPGGKGVAHWQ